MHQRILACLFLALSFCLAAADDGVEMTPKRADVKPFEYVPAKIPFYPAGKQWGTTGSPLSRMQKPLDPAESVKHMVVPVGFEVKLFAGDPQIYRPICMNWDERGRLWIVETVDYPNAKQRDGQGHDRIVICTDSDGDGQADTFTVFADKLNVPTSFTFARGGIIVLQAPHTLFLKDTDGDGVADEKRILFSGWGTYDTHAGPSNLRYGPENWIYGIVGYSGFNGEVGGEHLQFGQGFFRFRPDGSKLEFLRSTDNNSWGVGFSEEGFLFGSTANGNPSVFLPIPNRYYERVRGWSSHVLKGIAGNAPIHPITDKVRQVDQHGHFTAAAGHALYTARTYPRRYWNRTAFVCEPTGHLVATFPIQPDGADFRSHNGWNLLASDDEWTSPIMVEVGPDGHVWVIDWYNYIVQHNPTPPGFKTGKGNAYETPLRDKTHGRIYRLVWKEAKSQPALSLQDASPEKLVQTLRCDNMLWRLHAQRLLVERGKLDVLPSLVELVRDPSVDELGLNTAAMHGLWTLHGLGALDGGHPEATDTTVAALKHKSAGVRRSAVLILAPGAAGSKVILEAGLLRDSDPQVKLAALLALSDMPHSAAAAEAIAGALTVGETLTRDAVLHDAATSAAARHDVEFLQALTRWHWRAQPNGNLTALIERIAEHYARGVPAKTIGSLLEALPLSIESVQSALLAGLARGWPRDHPAELNAETEKVIATLAPRLSIAARGQLVLLTERWGSKALAEYAQKIVASLLADVENDKKNEKDRVEAATRLIDFRPQDLSLVRQMLAQVTPRTSSELARGILEAVGRSESTQTGAEVVQLLPSLTPAVRPAALRVLLGRSSWTGYLLDALDKRQIPLSDLSLQQQQQLASYPDRRLAARARRLLVRGGGLPNPDRQKVIEELLPLTKRTGDPARGKLVFQTQCTKCHVHSGEGAKIGPDLTGMNVHPKEHLLLEILDPSRSIEGNYRQYVLTTKDGRVLTGLLASESKTAVEMVDGEAKRHTILRDDIDELQTTAKSLMPEGFEKQLSADDMVNLLQFLTQRGKYLMLPLEKAATAISTRGLFTREDAEVERLVFDDWGAKTFEGVPFRLIDPQGTRMANVIVLNSPEGKLASKMPKSVSLPCNATAKAIHMLSGIGAWSFPFGKKDSVSLIVRLNYADGKAEEHSLRNGEEFADFIRRVDVPGSKFAFDLHGRQIRYLAIHPRRTGPIQSIELVKGPDDTAPVVIAVTVEAAK
jgi:putative membrane-bound dehydrogenase-like protein